MSPEVLEKLSAEIGAMITRVLTAQLSAPAPDEVIDLEDAARACIADAKRGAVLIEEYERGTGGDIGPMIAVAQNGLRWLRFWSVRHSDPAKRAKYRAWLAIAEPIDAENRAKARRHLERWAERGVAVPIKGAANG